MKPTSRMQIAKLVAVVALLGSSAASLAATGSFEETIAIDGDAIIDVSNQKGTVVIRAGDVDAVTIRARIKIDKRYVSTGPQKAARLIDQIKRSPPIESNGNHVIISELQKSPHRRFATVSYVILVPPEATVNVRSVSGDVRVSGVTGKVSATSETGKVTVADLRSEKSSQTTSLANLIDEY